MLDQEVGTRGRTVAPRDRVSSERSGRRPRRWSLLRYQSRPDSTIGGSDADSCNSELRARAERGIRGSRDHHLRPGELDAVLLKGVPNALVDLPSQHVDLAA